MAWIQGKATSLDDLLNQVITYITDTALHGADAFTVIQNKPFPYGIILRMPGLINGESSYMGMMRLDINTYNTYTNWFMSYENISSKIVYPNKGFVRFNISGTTISFPGDDPLNPDSNPESWRFTSLPGGIGINIFRANAQVLFFGMFKQFVDGFKWVDQPGGIEQFKTESSYNAGTLPIGRGINTSSVQPFTPPLMDGCGYPAIGFDSDGVRNPDGYIDFWCVKDKNRITIVYNDPDLREIIRYDNWEYISLGFLPAYAAQEYPWPAYICSTKTGVYHMGINFQETSGKPRALLGDVYDYTNNNHFFSHSILPYTSITSDSIPVSTYNKHSNAMLCTPDGRWESFSNLLHGQRAVDTNFCNNPTAPWAFVTNEPLHLQNAENFIRPLENEISPFTLQDGYLGYDSTDDEAHVYFMDKIQFVHNKNYNSIHHRQGVMGEFPRFYWPARPIYKYGLRVLNGKNWLLLPNIYQNRPWYVWAQRVGCFIDTDLIAIEERDLAEKRMRLQMNTAILLDDVD